MSIEGQLSEDYEQALGGERVGHVRSYTEMDLCSQFAFW